MAYTQMVAFRQVKHGNNDWEWEDGAAYADATRATGRARCIVVDGAAEAYDSLRWVGQLVDSFVGTRPGGPATLDEAAIDGWFTRMQREWADDAPDPSSGVYGIYEQHKAETGSFATLLGCEIDGLSGPTPRWTAAALGDTVLFHVRGGRLVRHFPAMRLADFGITPDGVFTHPAERCRMRAHLQLAQEPLEIGDLLYVATDAMAEWMLRTTEHAGLELWVLLREIDHPEVFTRLVADRRAAGELKNDDVTLLRVEITADEPDSLKVPQ